ncbi:TPA: class IV adenylate cyclase [candidate division CPR2 bacterium]|uniref:CYTH domain-containing protein n=1 Tax=candidate division CPR2 bacterium GW2011_GWC1_41_48 TaxID=1618344 RepID=A0A0G0Z8M9_UNCC2|nr:MAG: hypothetical protein UT47_C0002G0123 [candidate division CPR2 bacterium GW2011_GWC2_39_35]KKR27692.1 MAG: hypothetical protein UT60_C0040G0014 [candidate division CPR2 bacterium GW2011_GWD2_39_7]KKR28685.1 MAG: hypothetical protein UT59_C0021G0006 [candidate division CPR2 bacterium GW2011_GWD1_39_7]KKS09403.1 MAG: hypothetical protein UU65_C0002G0181 [candidate division CPR2 bacterium GW2011_GWC1_41_48]OGB61345.1 MAG: hypothetical protein A2Y27_00995 [candidate division CPR2 bacterium G
MSNDIEIEIKVRIKDKAPLLSFLSKNAKFRSTNHQIDEYYTPAHRNFLEANPVKEWLRLRDNDGIYSLDYKNWHFEPDDRSSYCDEYEAKIENMGQMRKILGVLDAKPIVIVDKMREIWDYNDYEIGIDSVVNLGDFVEIEYTGNHEKTDSKKITDEMMSFLKEIGCKDIKRDYVGYPHMLLYGISGANK